MLIIEIRNINLCFEENLFTTFRSSDTSFALMLKVTYIKQSAETR
jgi:hypothetical protein